MLIQNMEAKILRRVVSLKKTSTTQRPFFVHSTLKKGVTYWMSAEVDGTSYA
jgi:hypothetical protein